MRARLSRRAFTATAIAGTLATAAPACSLAAQSATPVAGAGLDAALGQLPTIVGDIQASTGVPGIAVAVVQNDEMVYAAGFGEREVGTGQEVGPDTVFQIASVSKPVSSTIVAALVGQGEVEWNSRMADLMPEFRLHDEWVTANVTVADLFSHRTGLPEHVGDLLEDLGGTREQVLESLRYIDLKGAFRASYAYTNFGLTAAAEGVARSMDRVWEDLADEVLFGPAGMTHTSFRHSDLLERSDRAVGHVRDGDTWVHAFDRQPDAQSPAGGVSSSVSDLARWMRLQLRNGVLDGITIADSAALGYTHIPHAISNMSAPPHTQMPGFYGLGWNVGYDATGTVNLSHSGAFRYGAATSVYLWPAEDLGIVVLTNGEPIGVAETICLMFHDYYRTGESSIDYLGILADIFAVESVPKFGADVLEPPANPEPPYDFASYAGTYTNNVFGSLDINLDDDTLTMTVGPDQLTFPLAHFSGDVFTYEPIGENAGRASAVTFTMAANGWPSQVVVENLNIYGAGTFVPEPAMPEA